MKALLFGCLCVALVATVQCAARNKNGRIIGGEPATAGEFPFIAALDVRLPSARVHCTASLISNQWLLTAAQCVYGASSIRITLGVVSLSDPQAVHLSTENPIVHPRYNPSILDNDIALIKLRMPIDYSNYIGPIHLAERDIRNHSVLRTAGWGQTTEQNTAPVEHLQQVEVITMPDADCKRVFGNAIIGHLVCVYGNLNEGTCKGDSGAPLIQYVNEWTPYLVGVSSFYSGRGCFAADPSGFTKVFPYLDWIDLHINDAHKIVQ